MYHYQGDKGIMAGMKAALPPDVIAGNLLRMMSSSSVMVDRSAGYARCIFDTMTVPWGAALLAREGKEDACTNACVHYEFIMGSKFTDIDSK